MIKRFIKKEIMKRELFCSNCGEKGECDIGLLPTYNVCKHCGIKCSIWRSLIGKKLYFYYENGTYVKLYFKKNKKNITL